MHLRIFTIYDQKAAAYLPPFHMATQGQALRALLDTASDPRHQFARHPRDFSAWELGTFDDSTAEIKLHQSPQLLVSLHELIAQHGEPADPTDLFQPRAAE